MKKPHAVFVLTIIAAALLSAAISHGVIDVLGDFVLAHDAFDDSAHGSRGLASSLALLFAVPALRSLLYSLLPRNDGGKERAAKIGFARTASAAIVTCALTILAVPSMEWLDLARTGADLDSIAQLFGGSIALGITVSMCCSAIFAGALAMAVGWFLRHRIRIATSIEGLLQRRNDTAAPLLLKRKHAMRPLAPVAIFARRRFERGPPNR